MDKPVRVVLIHATRLAMAPVEAAALALWPESEMVSILEEGLSIDRAANSVPMAEINSRIVDLARYAERLNPAGILYTCSAFSDGIEEAARTSSLPVLKPNEAMFEDAFNHGKKLVMIYTFPASVSGMEGEFRAAALQRNSNATITSVFAEGAREALNTGDPDTHNRIIAEVARGVKDADAILLAHFSMAQAVPEVRDAVNMPVLSSPESAILSMKTRVANS